MKKSWEDKELGTVILRKYARSRRYTIRVRGGQVYVSIPLYGTYKEALLFVEKNRTELSRYLKAQPVPKDESPEEIESLRKAARQILPVRLDLLARRHGFTYTSVRITKSRTRWGSCSSRQIINLSLFLMQLPTHLIDYVLLHELCHTRHMNHGPQFWSLLDHLCEGKALQLRKELRLFARHGR